MTKERKQMLIRINPDTHKQLKVAAALQGITINDFVEDAISQKLEKEKENK